MFRFLDARGTTTHRLKEKGPAQRNCYAAKTAIPFMERNVSVWRIHPGSRCSRVFCVDAFIWDRAPQLSVSRERSYPAP